MDGRDVDRRFSCAATFLIDENRPKIFMKLRHHCCTFFSRIILLSTFRGLVRATT